MRLKKGDTVMIITGKDRGKKGKVLEVSRSTGRLVVEGLNIRTKNVRARREREKGQRVQFAAPMHASNVMLICPKCGKATRVGLRRDTGKPNRVCKHCQNIL